MVRGGIWLVAIGACVLGAATVKPAEAEGFMAAAGKVEITPTKTAFIAGYAPNRRSTGAHDPLWARCLVMRSGEQTLALVSCDLIGLNQPVIQKLRKLVRRVPAERVIVGVTHTHSGPDTQGLWGPNMRTSGVDPEWMAGFLAKTAALVDETAARLQPAHVRFGHVDGIKRCSVNARVREILDTELGAMQVVGANGGTIGTLINYACHPETLNNRQMTSDFPHWLRTRVEEKLGGVAIYMNGAQGGMVTADIENESSYPRGQAWPEAERIGNTLGDSTLEALANATEVADPAITFRSRMIRVPLENPRFRALMQAGIVPIAGYRDGQITTEVSRFTIGPAEFLTLPGEVLPNLGLYLKRKMRGQPKFLLGLTGDALGYILTPQDYGLKLYGYETSMSVGSEMGARMADGLLSMMTDKKR